MESDDDHHTTAPAGQKPTNGDDDEVEQAGESKVVIITRSRSYECNFCKRGFSNAQALGGHMNIHRKDKKAKLKKTSTSGQTTHQPLFSLNNIHHKVPSLWHANSGHEEGSSYPKNGPTSRKVTLTLQGHETDLLLPLFADSPVNNSKETQKPDGQLVHDEIIITAERGLSSELLDLELRLGPDPDEDQDYSSATKTGTRKLFSVQ